jgi:hypothetical protein
MRFMIMCTVVYIFAGGMKTATSASRKSISRPVSIAPSAEQRSLADTKAANSAVEKKYYNLLKKHGAKIAEAEKQRVIGTITGTTYDTLFTKYSQEGLNVKNQRNSPDTPWYKKPYLHYKEKKAWRTYGELQDLQKAAISLGKSIQSPMSKLLVADPQKMERDYVQKFGGKFPYPLD